MDFDCKRPVKTWLLDMTKKGDQTSQATTFTREMQQKLVAQHAKSMTANDVRDRVSYPESRRCSANP